MVPQWKETAEKVCQTTRTMNARGLAALSSGNVSAHIPDSEFVAITPSGVPYDAMTPDDIVIIDLQGNRVHGTHRPSSETPFHTLVLRERTDVGALVHTHSPYAIAFSALREPIPLISNEGLGVRATRVEVTRYETHGTIELGYAAIEALDRQPGSRAVLLANHGLLAIGGSLEEAYRVAENVEIEAKIYHLACSLGTPYELTREQMETILESYAARKRD